MFSRWDLGCSQCGQSALRRLWSLAQVHSSYYLAFAVPRTRSKKQSLWAVFTRAQRRLQAPCPCPVMLWAGRAVVWPQASTALFLYAPHSMLPPAPREEAFCWLSWACLWWAMSENSLAEPSTVALSTNSFTTAVTGSSSRLRLSVVKMILNDMGQRV